MNKEVGPVAFIWDGIADILSENLMNQVKAFILSISFQKNDLSMFILANKIFGMISCPASPSLALSEVEIKMETRNSAEAMPNSIPLVREGEDNFCETCVENCPQRALGRSDICCSRFWGLENGN